ncbi:MAG: hypothetical protein K9K64_09095 [Desulfohalobiaceae bacterium]|nr:hypothetical protein [Desulfohalobiaceae bacterium]
MQEQESICYLCGKVLGDKISRDHVPPKQFYPKDLRKQGAPNLFSLPSHIVCNQAYQCDEDYFVMAIGSLAMDTSPGNSLWKDIAHQFARPQGERLGNMVFKEFNNRLPSGLYLPPGKVAKRFDAERVWRVVWKIVRGLFFKEYGRFLPPKLSDSPVWCYSKQKK